jgi:ABC-type branched-subunit amino acid transport system substrate-binding protein
LLSSEHSNQRRLDTLVKRLSFAFLLAWFAVLPANSWAQKGKIKIAVQAPLSGEQAALGEHIKLGAQLAVEESVKAFKALGYDLALVPQDDQAKPEVGVANARNMVADPEVLVIVGHFNSGVALPASEVYKDAMLAMISPANTATEITDRGYPNINRVCGRDDVQGPVGARFAAQELKAKSVYIIHDKTLYGQGVADNFRNEAKKLGINVLGFEGTEERANFSPMITARPRICASLFRRHLSRRAAARAAAREVSTRSSQDLMVWIRPRWPDRWQLGGWVTTPASWPTGRVS